MDGTTPLADSSSSGGETGSPAGVGPAARGLGFMSLVKLPSRDIVSYIVYTL